MGMNEKSIFDFGGKILESITNAAETGDFSHLSKDVKKLINGAVKGFSENSEKTSDYNKKSYYNSTENKSDSKNGTKTSQNKTSYKDFESFYRATMPNATKNSSSFFDLGKEVVGSVGAGLKNFFSDEDDKKTPFFSGNISKSKGKGKIFWGIVISIVSVPILLGGVNDFSLSSPSGIMTEIGFLVAAALALTVGIILIKSGKDNRKIIKDYFNFGKIIGKRSYITLKELSDATFLPHSDVVNKILSMKKQKFLPFAELDKDETTLMLTENVYSEYVKTTQKEDASSNGFENNAKNENADTDGQKSTSNFSKTQYYTVDKSLPKDVREILDEGNEYLNKIRYYNDLIPDTEVMSDKLYTLEATVLSIFKKVLEEPKIACDLRKFMSYYLPTTEKLLQSYVNLRNQSLSVENIQKSQKEIEEAMDMINDAFVKFLNQLFEATSWDISSDISVLKTMMKQDALL